MEKLTVDMLDEEIERSVKSSHVALGQMLQGDSSALGKMTQLLRPYLKLVVHNELQDRNVSHAEDESDIVQQALAQAVESLTSFQGSSLEEWKGWLAAIARNQTRMRQRYWRANQRSIHRQVDAGQASLELHAAENSTPSTIASKQEDARLLQEAISQLTDQQQQLIRWRQAEGLTHSQIAERLQINVSTARQRCKAAMDALRQSWRALQNRPGAGESP